MDARPGWLSFLPVRLLRPPTSGWTPGGARGLEGVVLIADVSGFTALSEAVAREGAAGTEGLSRMINEVFAPLVDLVHGHGGEVANFVGDAVVAVFPGQADAARSARDCSAAVLARAAEPTWPAPLTLSVGLAAGRLTSTVVGDPGTRLEHVLIGSVLARAARAAARAGPGEAMAEADVEAHAGAGGRLSPLVAATQIRREDAAPFVHPSVAARLDAGRDRMLAEHRRVTALFCRFEDLDEADPRAPERLQQVVATAVRTLGHFDGALLQVELVDKGSTLKATFGAPLAHEDDERRATACALALRERLPDAAFGLSSGTVLCGLIGSAVRREYTVLGDAVNVAARLMLAARRGQILATEAARLRAGEEWGWRALGPLALRGRSQPVTAFETTGRAGVPVRAHAPARADLIGRERERRQLIGALDGALHRSGGVFVMSGEAGIGKSRLLSALVADARARGFTVIRGAGQAYGRDSAYGAWRDAARELFGSGEHAPLLSPLLGVPLRGSPATAGLTPELRAAALRELVVDRVRERAAASPVLLAFEDCQWLDAPSRDLLERLAPELPALPVLLVLTERSGEGHERNPLPQATRITLGALAPDEIERVVHGAFSGTTPEALGAIVSRAGGNPLFAEELVHLVGDREAPVGALPDSLRAVVTARLDTLGEDERAVLRIASVVGRRFAPDFLWGSDPGLGGAEAINHTLTTLARLDIVRADGPLHEFKHAVTREVAYETLALEAREHLHASVARYVERTHALDRPDVLEALAHHYGHSADAGKQRVYFRRAGDAAREAFANETAIRHYRRLLPLLEADEQLGATLDLGAVLQLTGAWDEAEALYSGALAAAGRQGLPHAAARARAALGGLLGFTAAYPQAVRLLEQARAEFEALGARPELARVLERLSHTYFQQGDDERAMRCAREHAALARALGDRAGEGTAIGTLGLVLWHRGELEPARERLEAALALAAAAGHRVGVVHGLNDLAGLLVALDRPADALARLAEAYALSGELGYRRFAGLIVGNAAELFHTLGHSEAALECAGRSLQIAESLQDVLAVVHNATVIAAVRRRQGEPDEAARLLARVIRVAAAADNRRYLAEARLQLARAYRDLGRAGEARQAAGEALALASAVGQADLAAQADAFDSDRDAPPSAPLGNPFAGGMGVPRPEPAELVRRAEAALERWLAGETRQMT